MNTDERKKLILEYVGLGLQSLEGANGNVNARRTEIETLLNLTQQEILDEAKEILR